VQVSQLIVTEYGYANRIKLKAESAGTQFLDPLKCAGKGTRLGASKAVTVRAGASLRTDRRALVRLVGPGGGFQQMYRLKPGVSLERAQKSAKREHRYHRLQFLRNVVVVDSGKRFPSHVIATAYQ
jgi:hypothetical protein